MKRIWIAILVFAGLSITAPLFFFMIADAALMPLGGILMLLVFHLFEAPSIALLEVIHMAIYCPLLFWIAWFCSGEIRPPGSDKVRYAPLATVVGAIILIGVAPILRAGHGIYEGLNAFQFYPMMYSKLVSSVPRY